MGYKRVPTIYTLTFEGTDLDGLVVRMKSIKFGKIRQIIRLMDDDSNDVEMMEGITRELTEGIISWNLEEGDGTPIEVSAEAVDDLEFEEVMAVTNAWLAKMTGPGPELGKDSTSGEKFPGVPVTMEAL